MMKKVHHSNLPNQECARRYITVQQNVKTNRDLLPTDDNSAPSDCENDILLTWVRLTIFCHFFYAQINRQETVSPLHESATSKGYNNNTTQSFSLPLKSSFSILHHDVRPSPFREAK
jgi:hypothetical protein